MHQAGIEARPLLSLTIRNLFFLTPYILWYGFRAKYAIYMYRYSDIICQKITTHLNLHGWGYGQLKCGPSFIQAKVKETIHQIGKILHVLQKAFKTLSVQWWTKIWPLVPLLYYNVPSSKLYFDLSVQVEKKTYCSRMHTSIIYIIWELRLCKKKIFYCFYVFENCILMLNSIFV